MRKLSAAAVLVMVCGLSWAGVFELDEGRPLGLAWQGAPLISGDSLFDPDEFKSADDCGAAAIPGGKAVNIYRSSSDWLDYRRELAVCGGVAELVVRTRLYAYHGKDVEWPRYAFRVPVAALDGFTFRAVTGRPYRAKVIEGELSAGMDDGEIASGLAFLNLSGPKGNLTIDFARTGHGLYFNERNYAAVANAWRLEKSGGAFVFSVDIRMRWYGDMITSKVILLEGAHDYEILHPKPDEWHYGIGPGILLGIAFYGPAPEGFISLGLDAFTPEKRVGWADAAGLRLEPAVLGRMATGPVGTLHCETEPGFYLVTVRYGGERALGPFSISANGTETASDLRAAPNECRSATFPIRLSDGKLDLTFNGEEGFGVSAVLLQRLASAHEDRYLLERALWQVAGVPTPDKEIDPGAPPAALAPRTRGDASWRWNMAMACLGPSNSGSCNELRTYADIERRVVELEASGHNTIICNGLHFRLCHLSKRPMIQRNMKMICDVAHHRGLRVIEHHDVPVALAGGEGYQTLIDHADWLSRGIATGRVSTYFCVNNPGFKQWYYDWFEQYARETGIDGCMLDEVTFFGENYCGCEHCRAGFKRATGEELPYVDADGSVFFNKDNPLWVKWEKYRISASTDFFQGIRAILDRVNAGASILTYTTHYGFTTHYGSRRYGADIVDRARHIDFLGTEIMSRNVFESFRAVNAYRKTKNALMLHFDSPVYGLVYHCDDPAVAYFGWALQHMNRQVTWMTTIDGADMTRYINWQDKMNVKDARALADVALVFSRTCCNYNRSTSHKANVLGCTEMLSDAHIQHDVILDLDLEPETLRKYRLVILPSVECLSARQVAALETYVREGGALLVSSVSSQCDENGTLLEDYALAELMGVHRTDKTYKGPLRVQVGDAAPFELGTALFAVEADEDATVLAWAGAGQAELRSPALVRRAAGKGQCFFTPLALGGVNYDPELTVGDTYEFVLDEHARDMFIDIVRRATGGALTFEPVAIPERVLVTAYRIPDGYAVHFLNATGVRLEPGDVIPLGKQGEAFPAITQPLVFDLRVPGISDARAVSPDFPDARPVQVDAGDGLSRVTVPPEALQAYTIVYLD